MPFGSKNTLVFYTAMIKTFQEEWNADFDSWVVDPPNPVEIFDTIKCTRPSPIRTVFGSKIVIDDILFYGTNISQRLRYFSSVTKVFIQYRLSFKLSKYRFFSKHVQYLGYNLISSGNCPATWFNFELEITNVWEIIVIFYWPLYLL